MDSSVSPKEEILFLRVCHHISNAVYLRVICMGGPCKARNRLFHLSQVQSALFLGAFFVLVVKVYSCFTETIGFNISENEALLAPRPTPKLQDHPLSAVRDCLFNIFAAILHIAGRSSIRNLRTRHAVATGNHLSHGKYHSTFPAY